MKLLLRFICLFLALAAPALVAQLPVASTHNIMLDVVNKGAGGGVAESTGGARGSYSSGGAVSNGTVYTETKNHSTTLEITVRSQDKTPVSVQVEWYFFAKDLQNYHVKKEYLFDSGNKTITLEPTGTDTFDVASKVAKTSTSSTVVATTSNDPTTGSPSTSYSSGPSSQGGTKISGWVVRILVDGKLLDARGSEFKYEDAAKDPEQFEALKGGK